LLPYTAAMSAACLLRLLLVGIIATVSSASLRGTTSSSNAVTPVEKVIELLKGLQAQLEAESKEEAEQYDKYACFCKEQIDEKLYAIEKSAAKIEKLTAKIDKLSDDIAAGSAQVSKLSKQISETEDKIKKAADKRAKDHEKFEVKESDLVDAVDALKRAIEAMEDSKDDMKDAKTDLLQIRTLGASLMETMSRSMPTMPEKQVRALTALAQVGQKPTTYEYHSNDIIGTLKDLLKTFKKNLKEHREQEFEANSAFEKRDLNMKNEVKFATEDKDEAEKIVEYKTEQKEGLTGDKDKETSEMNADTEFQNVLKNECEEKAKLFDQRSTVRSGELTAIAEALEILTSKTKGAYSANKKLVELQTKKVEAPTTVRSRISLHTSFLQLRGTGKEAQGLARSRRVVQLLTSAGKSLKSELLTTVAFRAKASEDHFVKVRSIIKDIISKLADQAKAEKGQKSFCDKAMADAISSRDDANAEIEGLNAKKTRKEAKTQTTKDEIAQLSEEISMLKKGLMEATELRQAEEQENKETLETAKEGKASVELALKVLSEFYKSAGAELLQYVPPNSDREGKTVGDRAPEIFDDKYRGDQSSSKGIIGLLEVILSDFDRTIDKVTYEEKLSAEAFNKLKKDSETSIKEKNKSKSDKEDLIKSLASDILDLQNSLKDQTKLLAKALKALAELETKCVAGEETYDERVAKREAEIESLKKALDILENWQS